MTVETSFMRSFVEYAKKGTLAKPELAIPNAGIESGYKGNIFGSLSKNLWQR